MLNELINSIEGAKNTLKKPKTKMVSFFQMKEVGTYSIRLLPSKKSPSDAPFERVFVHYGYKNQDGTRKTVYKCAGKGCPLCQDASDKMKNGDKKAKRLKAKVQYLYYIVDLASDEVKIMSLDHHQQLSLQEELINSLKSGYNPMDIQKGLDLFIDKEYSHDGMPNYIFSFSDNTSPILGDISDYRKAPLLSTIHKTKDVETLAQVIKIA